MTEMTRAERRRAAREKEWVGFTPPETVTLAEVQSKLELHALSCKRCGSKGMSRNTECLWLERFFIKNERAMTALLVHNGFIADEDTESLSGDEEE